MVYRFNFYDGFFPNGAVILDDAGNLYGTTRGDGGYNGGTVYKLTPDGQHTLLHAFSQSDEDQGRAPSGRLVRDSQGNLYGTASFGGVNGAGVVFMLTPDGTYTVLHAFTGGDDGKLPNGDLIQDQAGNLYGTTYEGGSGGTNCPGGCGVVFEVEPDGSFTVLHTFTGGSEGENPQAGLVGDQDGNIYGTTINGGDTSCEGIYGRGCGTVFMLSSDGAYTVLYAFEGGGDGRNPWNQLFRNARTGALYGTTAYGGGSRDAGTVFVVTPDGSETVLHRFNRKGDGKSPNPIVQGRGTELIGATGLGGTHSLGTIYSLKFGQ